MRFKLKGRVIFFATDNVNKFNEARRILADYNVAVGMLRVKCLEIQSDSLEEVASSSVLDAYQRGHLPLIVEDAGLFVDCLNGFPGPYAAYAYRTIGNNGLLRLMEKAADRTARFESVVAYFDEGFDSPVCFRGAVNGIIATYERQGGGGGFGFDPVFIPHESRRTFAEMTLEEKNSFSHRAGALRRFGEWYRRSCR